MALPAQCVHGCKHGECVGPNKCKCFPGYTGKTCNQGRRLGSGVSWEPLCTCVWKCPVVRWCDLFADLNECGLKPRPCEHRCMNSYGSYKCYCLNGYTVTPDGSCTSEWCRPLEEQKVTKAVNLFGLFLVFRLQNLLSRSLSVWLWGGPGGDPLPLPVSRAAAWTGWTDLCRWGTWFGASFILCLSQTAAVSLHS